MTKHARPDDQALSPEQPPPLMRRLLVALAIGLFAAVASWVQTHRADFGEPPDFLGCWYAAKRLLSGENPYASGMLFYPLPALLAAAPFTVLPAGAATPVFSGMTSALLAYVVTRTSYVHLPLFLSAGFAHGAVQGQWSMLLTAAVFAPVFSAAGAIKPNIGLALVAHRPRWTTVLPIVLFGVLSLAVMPDWPRHWLANFGGSPGSGTLIHSSPLTTPFGFLGLLALLRWRRPEARLLAAMVVVPQSPFSYEVLPLFAIARTRFESYALVIGTDIALCVYALAPSDNVTTYFRANAIAILFAVYLPAVWLVLRRPNEGSVPNWIERVAAYLPVWLRGRPNAVA